MQHKNIDYNLFKNVFKNIVIRKEIFNQVKLIHTEYFRLLVYSWQKLVNTPLVLIKYNYIELFKDFLKRSSDHNYPIDRIAQERESIKQRNRNISATELTPQAYSNYEIEPMMGYIEVAISHCRFNILNYIIKDLGIIITEYLNEQTLLRILENSRSPEMITFVKNQITIAPKRRSELDLYKSAFIQSAASADPESVRCLAKLAGNNGIIQAYESAIESNRSDLLDIVKLLVPLVKMNRFAPSFKKSRTCCEQHHLSQIARAGALFSPLAYLYESTGMNMMPQIHRCAHYVQEDAMKSMKSKSSTASPKVPDLSFFERNPYERSPFDMNKYDTSIDYESPNYKISLLAQIALYNNKTEVVEWLIEYVNSLENLQVNFININLDRLAFNGQLDSIIWATNKYKQQQYEKQLTQQKNKYKHQHQKLKRDTPVEIKIECSTEAMDLSSATSFPVLKWLSENRSEGCSVWSFFYASCYNQPDTLKYLIENHKNDINPKEPETYVIKIDPSMIVEKHGFRNPCFKGHALRSMEPRWKIAMEKAADNGNLDVVKWLFENKKDVCSERTVNSESARYPELIRYLVHNRIVKEWNLNTWYALLENVKTDANCLKSAEIYLQYRPLTITKAKIFTHALQYNLKYERHFLKDIVDKIFRTDNLIHLPPIEPQTKDNNEIDETFTKILVSSYSDVDGFVHKHYKI